MGVKNFEEKWKNFKKSSEEKRARNQVEYEQSLQPVKPISPITKKNDILDETFKGVWGKPDTPFLPEFESQIKEDIKKREELPTEDYNYPEVVDEIGAFANKTLDSATLGLKPLIEKKVDPVNYNYMQNVYKENPKASFGGTLSGYLLPGIAASKIVKAGTGVLKNIPVVGNAVSRLLPGTDFVGKMASAGLYGATEGALMGSIEGVNEAIREGFSPEDIAKNAAIRSAEFGLGGAVLGGAGSAIGQAASKLIPKIKNFVVGENVWRNPVNQEGGIYRPMEPLTMPDIDNVRPIEPLQNVDNIRTMKPNIRPLQNTEPPQMNLQNFSTDIPNTSGIEPTINRIVDSTDRLSLSQKLSNFWNKTYNNWIDSQTNIKPFSTDVYETATNTKKVGGTVDYILKDSLVNQEGIKIGESLKNIGSDIPKNKEAEFMDYLLHRHNTDRFRENKPVFPDYNDNQSYAQVMEYEKNNPEFKDLAKRFDKFLAQFRNTWLKDTGLVAEDVIADWAKKYPNYVPTYRKFNELELDNPLIGARQGYVDQVSPVRTATGSSRDIINPIEGIMHSINKTVRVARRNQVGQQILQAVRQEPERLRPYAEILPQTRAEATELANTLRNDTVDGAINEIENNFINPMVLRNRYDNVVTVLENGQPVFLQINDKRFLDAIRSLNEVNAELPFEKSAKFVVSIFKSLVTQKNPIFALRNVMRDIPTAYVYGSEGNPFRFGIDYLSAVKNIVKNDSSYQQYKALGGKMGGFFNPGDLTLNKQNLLNKSFNPLRSIGDFFETINQATESAPRLAEFKRVLEKTGDVQKALYAGGEVTVNFSRGGKMAKSVDTYVPYFNASLQGLDRFLRAVVDNPVGTTIKGTLAITIPTAVMEIQNRLADPENYDKLDNRTKDAYFVFSQGDGKFIKIPKSREIGVLFSSLFQRISALKRGQSEPFKGFGNTIATNFSPANPIENNILSPLFLNLRTNKDFADRPIVPMYMQDRSPELQYDEKTSEIAKKIGEVCKLSPKQVDYIIRSYSGIIGQLLQPLTTTQSTTQNPFNSAFTSDVAYSNKDINDFYENLEKLNTAAADKNFRENIPSKKVTDEEKQRNAFAEASKYMSFLRKQSINSNADEKRQKQFEILNIAEKMNKSLENGGNQKKLLRDVKPKGFKNQK